MNGFDELEKAWEVTTTTLGSNTYALVTSKVDDGIQVININDPTSPTAAGSLTDGVNGFNELDGSWGITTTNIGEKIYAISTGSVDDGVQIIQLEAVDKTAPIFSSAETSTDGNQVILTYNENLSTTTASASAFSVTSGGTANTITNASISGKTIELSLARTINSNESVTVTYNDPTGGNDANAVQDTSGNDASSLGSTSVTNTRPSAGNDPQTIITTVSDETTQATEQIPKMKEESKKLAPTTAQPYPASLASDEQDSRKKSIPLFNTENLNDSFGAGRSNDGIGTALNIFGATLLALINPAVAIRNFLENLKGSGSKEICENADTWESSEFCSQINFEQSQATALLLPTDVQVMAPQARANLMTNPAALGLEALQPQADPWWPDQTAQGF